MSNDNYLREILDNQDLSDNQINNLRNLRDKIENQIRVGMKGAPIFYYAGSYKNKTMIKAGYDLDIVAYWPPDFPYNLESIYRGIGSTLEKNWDYVKSKKVGWEIPFQGNFHIDVIPGKFSSSSSSYAYLFNRKTGGRFQTSIQIQTEDILNSRRQDVIRLFKLWKIRKNVPIKTFILEQMVIDGCKGLERNLLEKQLNKGFQYIFDNILTKRIEDPANSNNIVSNDISSEQKYRIEKLANNAIEAKSWGEVFS